MAAPERSRLSACVVGLGAFGLLLSCRSVSNAPPDAAPLPPQTLVSAPTAEPAAQAASAAAEAARDEAAGAPARAAEEKAKSLIVIEPAEPLEIEPSQDLAAAARREKERRLAAQQPIAVINQKNLASWAAGGVLTQAEEPAAPSAADAAVAEAAEKAAIEEAYWRRRGREVRERWRAAEDSIAVLEAKTANLRNRYYSADDGYQRDSQIKPEWDKAIADLEEARYQSSRGEAEVRALLDEGRRAGALPGWLREGAELEPVPVIETAAEVRSDLEATEPVIYRDPASGDDEGTAATSEDDEPPGGDGAAGR